MTALPTVGGDNGSWGTVLNDFLSQEHNSDGTQKTLSGDQRYLLYATAPVSPVPPIQTYLDPSGTYPTPSVIFGNRASLGYSGFDGSGDVYGPGANAHHAFGDYINRTNAPITKSVQGMFRNFEFWGPTTNDSAQGGNTGVFLKNTGTPWTQPKYVTGEEFDVQIEGGVTVTPFPTLGAGSRTTILTTGHSDSSYGFKANAYTVNNKGTDYGTLNSWRAFYDDLYNPAGSSFAANESFHGLNQISGEQGLVLGRTGYAGEASLKLQGSGGSESALLNLTLPTPNNTTSIADGVFSSGSNLMTTATAPNPAWIGRVATNASIPAGTQVLNYYGTGPYTIILTANATATATGQTVTITEPTLSGIRINMGTAQASGNAISVYDTTGAQRFVISRAGFPITKNVSYFAQNSTGQTVSGVNPDGSLQSGSNVGGSGVIGAKIWSGTGAPNLPGNTSNPTAGDLYIRTDTPSTANQRIYICTVGGATPTWGGIV